MYINTCIYIYSIYLYVLQYAYYVYCYIYIYHQVLRVITKLQNTQITYRNIFESAKELRENHDCK